MTTTFALDSASALPEVIYTSEGHAYLHLPGLIMTENISGEVRYLLGDGLGSVRQVVDENAELVVYYEFDPYGNPVQDGGEPYGYTGEWWEDEVGLLHLRARWYAPELGRFINKDPFSGFVNNPQSLNRWAYVQGSPTTRTDPTGLLAQNCENCGPKIDDWFLEEIHIHWDWVAQEKHMFDLETAYMLTAYANNPAIDLSSSILLARQILWTKQIGDYLKAIPYKWMNFNNLVRGCPSSGHCRNSVTLCDQCVDRSNLGNFMFGFSAKIADLSNSFTFFSGHDLACGLQETWDQSAAGVGYHYGTYNMRVLNSKSMCQVLREAKGKWSPNLLSEGKTVWRWDARVQDKHLKGCKLCAQAIPSSTPHTTPAYAGQFAGKSPYAGAPKYLYLTDQIPEGMLDPQLEIAFDSGWFILPPSTDTALCKLIGLFTQQ